MLFNVDSQDDIFMNGSRKTSSTALGQMSAPPTPAIQRAMVTFNPLLVHQQLRAPDRPRSDPENLFSTYLTINFSLSTS